MAAWTFPMTSHDGCKRKRENNELFLTVQHRDMSSRVTIIHHVRVWKLTGFDSWVTELRQLQEYKKKKTIAASRNWTRSNYRLESIHFKVRACKQQALWELGLWIAARTLLRIHVRISYTRAIPVPDLSSWDVLPIYRQREAGGGPVRDTASGPWFIRGT